MSDTARTRIVDALRSDVPSPAMRVCGWARTVRANKQVAFIELNDGTSQACLQVVANPELPEFEAIGKITTGSSVEVVGTLVESPAKGQRLELHADSVRVIGLADSDYPLQKKRHSFEFLRSIAHLRPRTNSFGAVFRVRSALALATHEFFGDRGFVYVHTPIITASDCEGAGEMFRVSTIDPDDPPKSDGRVDYQRDFFGKPSFLTVSGQLNGEAFALGMSDIYTFGPTFRAENSNTSRHVAEFWMIEPEMAFCDLSRNCDVAEAYVRHLLRVVLDRCGEDLAFFNARIAKGLIDRLEAVASSGFERMSYREAVSRLESSGQAFEHPVHFGANLQAEHERWLTEEAVGRPLFVTDYPKDIKAFYMRQNDDGETVAAMDLLVPGIGELIGGSQREERLDVLRAALQRHDLPEDVYSWYLDTRRYGTAPHAGFGLGFERMVMYATGMENIRDVIPFPRTPRNCAF